MALSRGPFLSAEGPRRAVHRGTAANHRLNRPMTERSVNIASQWEAPRGRRSTAEAVAAAAEMRRKKRRRRRRRRWWKASGQIFLKWLLSCL